MHVVHDKSLHVFTGLAWTPAFILQVRCSNVSLLTKQQVPKSPLVLGVEAEDIEIVQILLEAGAKPDAPGSFPLHVALDNLNLCTTPAQAARAKNCVDMLGALIKGTEN